jgi:spore coat protein H
MKSKSLLLLSFSLVSIVISCTKQGEETIDPSVLKANPDWATASHSKDGKTDYTIVFPQDKVNTLEITLGKTTWESIKTDMVAKNKGVFGSSPTTGGGNAGGGGVVNPPVGGGGVVNPPVGGGNAGGAVPNFGPEPTYVEATLKFNNKTWNNVGFRLKGNSTLSRTWKAGIYKLPIRLKMDEFEDKYPAINDQRFYGFKELSFSPGVNDNSLIREKVTADIFRMAGIPAARTTFTKLYIDFGEGLKYCGVYTMLEIVDDTMLKDQLGEEKGNIYKPESTFATFSQASFEKKNNDATPDWSDVQTTITSLNASNRTTDAATWRANLEKTMNMEQFVKWLAVNTTLVNWDTYGGIAHNHYLYNHSTQKLLWIPWDNNEALTNNARVQLNLSGVANTWPLIKFVAEDPIYYAKYKAYVKDFNDTVFTTSKMNEIFDKATTLITPFVNGTEKEVAPYTNLTNVASFTSSLAQLKTHVVTRNQAVAAFLK